MIAYQLVRSGTSVGAHYCEGIRGRSDAELISKLEAALQELDETAYWLELLAESGIVRASKLIALRDEAEELIKILVTCVKNVKARRRR